LKRLTLAILAGCGLAGLITSTSALRAPRANDTTKAILGELAERRPGPDSSSPDYRPRIDPSYARRLILGRSKDDMRFVLALLEDYPATQGRPPSELSDTHWIYSDHFADMAGKSVVLIIHWHEDRAIDVTFE